MSHQIKLHQLRWVSSYLISNGCFELEHGSSFSLPLQRHSHTKHSFFWPWASWWSLRPEIQLISLAIWHRWEAFTGLWRPSPMCNHLRTGWWGLSSLGTRHGCALLSDGFKTLVKRKAGIRNAFKSSGACWGPCAGWQGSIEKSRRQLDGCCAPSQLQHADKMWQESQIL